MANDQFLASVGESASEWKKVDPQWDGLTTAVAMVETHCSWWRAETSATLDDLGLGNLPADERKAMNNLLNLGQRYLLPKRIIKHMQYWENQQRQNLYRKSLRMGADRLVAKKNYVAWLQKAESVRESFYALVNNVAEQWDDLAREVDNDYRALGTRAYRQMVENGHAPAVGEVEWVDQFVRRATAKRISAAQWQKEASMTWQKSYIPLQAMIERAKLKEAGLIKVDTSDPMARDIEADETQMLDSGLYQFMASMRSAISDNVLNVVADCLDAFKKNHQVLPRNSSKQLKNLIAKVDEMVFWDDPVLQARLAEVESLLEVRSDLRDKSQVEQALVALGTEARMLLVELDQAPARSTIEVGIPDSPVDLSNVQTMQRHGIDLDIGDELDEFDLMDRHGSEEIELGVGI